MFFFARSSLFHADGVRADLRLGEVIEPTGWNRA